MPISETDTQLRVWLARGLVVFVPGRMRSGLYRASTAGRRQEIEATADLCGGCLKFVELARPPLGGLDPEPVTGGAGENV